MKRFSMALAALIAASSLSVPVALQAGTIEGTVTAKGARDARDAVVYVDVIKDKVFPPPKEHAKMDQKNMVFIPHVLPVLAGTTVDFLNSDDVLHNVFTPDKCAQKFNLGTWPKGQSRAFTFKQVGCAAVMLCNVHPEMEAFVVASPTPYFAKTGPDGKFRIEGVPAGSYTVQIWHEKLKASPAAVTVPAEGTATIAFALAK
ncbi:MAG: carboxypeptidase regulatory-like domain-containing protein [Candidatus Latescibacteria bacterium]|nr:carboxypeptidase regulatory-like domain-containing protein [Candidatus Latescibacterota bacterium]